jgi:hypothetical protein
LIRSDIGGGWKIDTHNGKPNPDGINVSDFQLSDIALQWMLHELQETEKENDPEYRLKFTSEMEEFMATFTPQSEHYTKALAGRIHDLLQFHGGNYGKQQFFKTFGWWILGRDSPA